MDGYAVFYWIIAIALLSIMLFLLVRLLKEKKEKDGRQADASAHDAGKTGRLGNPQASGSAEGRAGGNALLYIPPEMAKGPGGNMERATPRGDSAGEEIVLIYRYQERTGKWSCPCCEAENRMDSNTCLLCGRKMKA